MLKLVPTSAAHGVDGDNDEVGASTEVSGRGFQQGEFSGLELAVKDNERFKDMPGGRAYLSFGHKPQPYESTAKRFLLNHATYFTKQAQKMNLCLHNIIRF